MIPRVVQYSARMYQAGDIVRLKSPLASSDMTVIYHRLTDNAVICRWGMLGDWAAFDAEALKLVDG